jgi:hypothetical protein
MRALRTERRRGTEAAANEKHKESNMANTFGLKEGDTFQIGEHEYTYHNSYGTDERGFALASVEQCSQFCDGVHQVEIDSKGRVNLCGAIIGEVKDGQYRKYAQPII